MKIKLSLRENTVTWMFGFWQFGWVVFWILLFALHTLEL